MARREAEKPAKPIIETKVLEHIFWASFGEFLKYERDSIINDVSERSLCGRWLHYMQRVSDSMGLSRYVVDIEYNRNRGEVKTILDHRPKVVNVVCDLILHRRGQVKEQDNLIAIELKKSTNLTSKQSDRDRLRALTKSSYDGIWSADGTTLPEHVCGYGLGYFVDLDLGSATYLIEEFRDGTPFDAHKGKF
jgi:hypothetical protein